MSIEFVKENEKKLIRGYPNTYTFTKSMAERMIKKRCSDGKVSIIRPSIVIGTYEEPFPGWAENLAAGGGITLTAGIGILRNIKSDPNIKIDTVPCDYVANFIIAVSVYASIMTTPRLSIYHASSSLLNPISNQQYLDILMAWAQKNPFYKQVFEPKSSIAIKNVHVWKVSKFFDEDLPTKALQTFAKLPLIGNKAMVE